MKINIAHEIETHSMDRLILKYAIPAILSGLVIAVYNIVDQVFIGNIEGVIGNSATNVAFPLVTLTTAIALLFGIGSTANFSISLGRKDINSAKKFAGTAVVFIPLLGILVTIIMQLFASDLLWLFGATDENYELALSYTKIVSLGYPFAMTIVGLSHLIRADGSPKYSLFCTLSGAVLNCVLNPILMVGFGMGIEGAAWATVIGQLVSVIIIVKYLFNFRTFNYTKDVLIPKMDIVLKSISLGAAPAVNQLSMTITQIVMNNALVYYGTLSVYGADIPLACAGIISKVNMIYITIMIGIAQGNQPIIGYNFGANRYDKVKECYIKSLRYGSIFSVIVFIAFQVFPTQIISLFGEGSTEYFEFATRYFKIFLLMTFLNGIQPITGNFFTAIGSPIKGALIAFTKQIFFLTPLVLILPMFWGIDGILYAGPIADTLTFFMTIIFVYIQFKKLK